jgi:hypothetical protein
MPDVKPESPPPPTSYRALAAIAAVAALALAGALDYYQFLSSYSRSPEGGQVAAQAERFRGVLAALPPAGAVGYLSDRPPGGTERLATFGIAQYALAPRVLVTLKTGQRLDWVIGDFASQPDAARLAAEYGLSVAADYGNGVVLFRGNERP